MLRTADPEATVGSQRELWLDRPERDPVDVGAEIHHEKGDTSGLRGGCPDSLSDHSYLRDTGRTMSRENVEFVRRAYALLDQGDTAVWDLVSAEFVLDFSRRLIDPVVLRGREQVRAWAEGEAAEPWEGGRTGW